MEQIEHCGAILAYKKIGEGENVVILFYGYAQNNAVFDALTAGLLESHTFYIVDLFFHGTAQNVPYCFYLCTVLKSRT